MAGQRAERILSTTAVVPTYDRTLEVRGRDAFLSLNEKTWRAIRRFELSIGYAFSPGR